MLEFVVLGRNSIQPYKSHFVRRWPVIDLCNDGNHDNHHTLMVLLALVFPGSHFQISSEIRVGAEFRHRLDVLSIITLIFFWIMFGNQSLNHILGAVSCDWTVK